MLPRRALRFLLFPVVCLFLLAPTLPAQIEPQGLLVYQEPATSYTEAWEYRSFRQDNALYTTLVTFSGQRKQLKAAGVVAVLSYPPASFDAEFPSTAKRALDKIDALVQSHPLVRGELDKARGKWSRALQVFNQTQAKTPNAAVKNEHESPATLAIGGGVLQSPRITSATLENVTLMHASGVTTIPVAQLTAAQVLALNRTSEKVQLPLGITRPATSAPAEKTEQTDGNLTSRIGRAGRAAVDFCAEKLGVTSAAFSTWTFFVVLPLAIVLLLLGLIVATRRSAAKLPKPR